jgi:4-hydroxybenzoyl-CoA thioesterase
MLTTLSPDLGAARSIAGHQAVISERPFTVRRRVRWGDCDSGGIVYTPNVLDYAVETAEAWFDSVIGMHWSRLAPDHGLGLPFVNCAIEFRRMLFCNQEFDMKVRVEDVRTCAYALEVMGSDIGGAVCFRASLAAAFIELRPPRKIPMPASIRECIEHYREEQAQ